jgi:polyketide cyclase/dehydrase/lipid transport protein
MLKKVLIGVPVVLLLLLLGFAGVVAMQPSAYVVTRSADILASPEEVFAQVNDFHRWEAWSPWAKLDPNAENSFDGPSEGKDATFRWSGNDQIGEGRMTILQSRSPELVQIELVFVRPFADIALTEFAVKPVGEQTRITWSMSGKHTFMSKAMCMFMDMDRMLGGQFAEGLENMKRIAEQEIRDGDSPKAVPPSDAP